MTEIKRGPKPQYNFAGTVPGDEITVDASLLSSFKSLLSRFNKGKDDKAVFNYTFKANSSKVTATRIQPASANSQN